MNEKIQELENKTSVIAEPEVTLKMYEEIQNIVVNDHSVRFDKIEKVDSELDVGKRIIEIEKALIERTEKENQQLEK